MYKYFVDNETGIIVNKSVIIDLDGHTVDANGNGRVFNITGDDVIIKNGTITNADADGEDCIIGKLVVVVFIDSSDGADVFIFVVCREAIVASVLCAHKAPTLAGKVHRHINLVGKL